MNMFDEQLLGHHMLHDYFYLSYSIVAELIKQVEGLFDYKNKIMYKKKFVI
jgi:hypothetical protein